MKIAIFILCISSLTSFPMKPSQLHEDEVIERAKETLTNLVNLCSYTFTNRCDADAGLGAHNIGYINPQMIIFVKTLVPSLKTTMNELFLVGTERALNYAYDIPGAFKSLAEKTPLTYKGYNWVDKKDMIHTALKDHLDTLKALQQQIVAEEVQQNTTMMVQMRNLMEEMNLRLQTITPPFLRSSQPSSSSSISNFSDSTVVGSFSRQESESSEN